jgi:lipoate-protein ligase A
MPHNVGVWDSGLNRGGWNTAFDHRWLALHTKGRRPDLLRFHRSLPTASLGRYQAADRELRLDYCRDRGIEVVRRTSGGGALYLDPGQQGLSLIITRPAAWTGMSIAGLLEKFCAALAGGLVRLGVDTAFKPPNDLEVDGRKLASAFLAVEGGSLLFHATVLLSVDVKTMLETLRAPTEKLTVTGLESARERLATLGECLGHLPESPRLREALRQGLEEGLEMVFSRNLARDETICPDDPECTGFPPLVADAIDWSNSSGRPLEALWRTPGGTLRARFHPDAGETLLQRAEFAGDVHLAPPDLFHRLGAALAGIEIARVDTVVRAFFEHRPVDMPGFTVEDIRRLAELVLDKLALRQNLGLGADQANGLMVFSRENEPAAAILERADTMLVPYCAKCGECEVGDAYRLARERNLQVTTIVNYEHLVATLREMKARGSRGYVGMCCSQFFVKRHQAFREAELPAVLLDISGANCYELKQENLAYAGQFHAEARLDTDALRKVMKRVPPAPG